MKLLVDFIINVKIGLKIIVTSVEIKSMLGVNVPRNMVYIYVREQRERSIFCKVACAAKGVL